MSGPTQLSVKLNLMESTTSRIKAWHMLLLLIAVCVIFVLYLAFGRAPHTQGEVIKTFTPFAGLKLEASGVAAVEGSDGLLLVDNKRNAQVFWMQLDQNGNQSGEIKSIDLGVDIEDIEGITEDGKYFYVVSSQSRPKAIASLGLVRFKFDARSQSAQEIASIGGLKDFLLANVDELRAEGERKGKEGGINIEGLAWDPRKSRLLIGLRSPIVEGNALLVPLELRDPQGPFSLDNLQVENKKAIKLDLGGIGIRSIEYDQRSSGFKIISGAAEDQKQTDFGLWEWNGDEKQGVLRLTKKFEKNLKPEGVARVVVGKRDFLIVVFDAGGYTIVN